MPPLRLTMRPRRTLQTIRNLDFLEQWRDFLLPYHLIVIQARAPFGGAGEGPAAAAVRPKLRSASAPRRAWHAFASNYWCTLAKAARSGTGVAPSRLLVTGRASDAYAHAGRRPVQAEGDGTGGLQLRNLQPRRHRAHHGA